MARLNFLTVTDTSSWIPVLGADGAFLAQHAFVRSVLLDTAPDLADLFAEPVYRRQPSGKIDSVTWYTQAQGAIKKLNHLDPDFRENILADLTVQISKCVALLDHAEIGQTLAAMLQLGAKDSIMVVGRKPVLINWALHDPALIDADHIDRDVNALWQELLGQQGFVVFSESETDNSAAQFEDTGGDISGKASLPAIADSVVPDETFDEQPLDDVPGPDGTNEHDLDQPNGTLSVEQTATDDLGRAEVTRDANVELPDPSWRDRLLFWGGWIVSAILLVLLLLLLWWYFWGQYRGDQPSTASVLDDLRAERNRLLELLEDPCAPAAQGYIEQNGSENPAGVMSGPGGGVVSGSATGVDGSQNDASAAASTEAGSDANTTVQEQQVTPEDGQSGDANLDASSARPKDMTELAKAAEKSVVLILSASRNGGAAMGTGFFISPQFIVTNRHVVEQSRDLSAFVTSEWLGDVQKAKVVAMSPDAEIGNADFALLKLANPSTGVPLPVSNRIDKLMRVVSAGYPAFLTQGDPALERLIGGDRNSAPEMVFTTGEVSVVQKHPNKPDIVIHSADISQGNSGGPLMNMCGDVVGVNTFVGQDAQSGRRGLFSISGADLQDFLNEHGASFQSAVNPCVSRTGE